MRANPSPDIRALSSPRIHTHPGTTFAPQPHTSGHYLRLYSCTHPGTTFASTATHIRALPSPPQLHTSGHYLRPHRCTHPGTTFTPTATTYGHYLRPHSCTHPGTTFYPLTHSLTHARTSLQALTSCLAVLPGLSSRRPELEESDQCPADLWLMEG
ncbi:hypothetical protein C0Q70_19842 [Pomacea canaliculata]|uniref:Uncharacterized protein n=1 Tax=Pomacea canaliculata TaxID=400727 RepID=A0A2T7NDV4_POMCA|nr:hypothetical protein C0Q70_19842 [Pomacea canaliculata]